MSEIKSEGAKIDDYKEFIFSFKKGNNFPYFDQARNLALRDDPIFKLDHKDLLDFAELEKPYLLDGFDKNPKETINILSQAVKSAVIESTTDEFNKNVTIRITNYENPTQIRKIGTKHNNKLVSFEGIIVSCSDVKPYLTSIVLKCDGCNSVFSPNQATSGDRCECEKGRIYFDESACKYVDTRIIKIQELTEDMPAGELPVSKSVHIFGEDLTDSSLCTPGTRVKVLALPSFDYESTTRAMLKAADPLALTQKQVFGGGVYLKQILIAQNIERKEIERNISNLTEAELEKFKSFKNENKEKLAENLINSFAPHVVGNEDIKEAILLQIVDSAPLLSKKSNDIDTRDNIHILLIGNAGTAKSSLLLFAHKVAPRVLKTSGKGSSAAGLTASAAARDDDGKHILEAGAMVLADLGLLIVDEFDKMRDEDKSSLHEGMEQQTISINKSGISAVMNARTSILAAGNPSEDAYDYDLSLSENINIPSTLLSRFDGIFVVPDVIEENRDKVIGKSILAQFKKKKNKNLLEDHNKGKTIYPVDFLSKYLYYIRNLDLIPELTEEAETRLINFTADLRQRISVHNKNGSAKSNAVTLRINSSIYRLAAARARLLQCDKIDLNIINKAIDLVKRMFRSMNVDLDSARGQELENIFTQSQKSKQQLVFAVLTGLTDNGKNNIHQDIVINDLVKTGKFDETKAIQTIHTMEREGTITRKKGNILQLNMEVFKSG